MQVRTAATRLLYGSTQGVCSVNRAQPCRCCDWRVLTQGLLCLMLSNIPPPLLQAGYSSPSFFSDLLFFSVLSSFLLFLCIMFLTGLRPALASTPCSSPYSQTCFEMLTSHPCMCCALAHTGQREAQSVFNPCLIVLYVSGCLCSCLPPAPCCATWVCQPPWHWPLASAWLVW